MEHQINERAKKNYLFNMYHCSWLFPVRVIHIIIPPLLHFTILGQKNVQKYATLLHCRTGQIDRLKRNGKMAAQNKPNFALFTSSDLDFLENGEIVE